MKKRFSYQRESVHPACPVYFLPREPTLKEFPKGVHWGLPVYWGETKQQFSRQWFHRGGFNASLKNRE